MATPSLRLSKQTLTPLLRHRQPPPLRLLPHLTVRHQSTAHHLPSSSTNVTPPTAAATTATTRLPPLGRLPAASLVRALLLHSVTANPTLLKMGTKVLMSQVGNMERGPVKWVVDASFYAQFCAGSTEAQVRATVASLRSLGFSGAILNYAREVSLSDTPSAHTQSAQISQWLDGTLKTISYSDAGSYIAIKYSGAGHSSLPLLLSRTPCTTNPQLADALTAICSAAADKGVKLLMDAEQSHLQPGVDAWTLALMRRFNTAGRAVVYNTYQMYLRRAPEVLAAHVAAARAEGFTLGVKLVRGAYLASDPRELIHATKADTDAAYDGALRYLMTGEDTKGHGVDLMVATHNKTSVTVARELMRANTGVGELSFAQLMGMADELSLGLVAEGEGDPAMGEKEGEKAAKQEKVKVYKYAAWGTTAECVRYLVRRAEENLDAVGRSAENRAAVWGEVKRRVVGA
ncbi:proline oxidase [Geopyxis carbonaria]|nr:proline oxidase [Geopyxis carbonaria]